MLKPEPLKFIRTPGASLIDLRNRRLIEIASLRRAHHDSKWPVSLGGPTNCDHVSPYAGLCGVPVVGRSPITVVVKTIDGNRIGGTYAAGIRNVDRENV